VIRPAESAEVPLLAQLWHDGWHDAHAAILPAALTAHRTLASFEERIRAALPTVRVAGPSGDPSGFHILKGDELYQLYVSARHRGAGIAAALMADVEKGLRTRGYRKGWLACAIGNTRAARFYEKQGWVRTATIDYDAVTPDGSFPIQVWRYERDLMSGPPAP
jgi:GNAT superfamily N-acetyltransferase